MSKKWSQFDPFTALAGDEEIVGLQGGTNKRGAVNGVFKTFFDDLYWPLGGAAELTGALSVDGNGNTLDLIDLGGFSVDVGVNNMAFTGAVLSLEATNSIVWNVDDGVDVTDIDIDPNSVTVSTTDIHLNTTNSFNASADDGVDSSYLSLAPTLLDIGLSDGGAFYVSGSVDVIFGSDGITGTNFDTFILSVDNQTSILSGAELTLGAITVRIAGNLAYDEIQVPEIQANQNNYNPTQGSWYYLTSDASWEITGWVPARLNGDQFTAYNGGSFDIIFTHNDTGNSTPANCFTVPGGGDFALNPGKSVTWKYSAVTDRWIIIASTV